MTAVTCTPRFSVWLMTLQVLLPLANASGSAAPVGDATRTPATSPKLDIIRALQAACPRPSLGDAADIFDRFVVTWDGKYTEYSMDGRAMQDLFIIHPSAERSQRHMGTTLRYYDPKSRTCSVTFIDLESYAVETLTDGAVGDDLIVLHSQDADSKQRRSSFVDIRPDSWLFRDEASRDGGKTWKVVEETRWRGIAQPGASAA